MDIGSILLILSTALLSAVFVIRPFLRRPPDTSAEARGDLQDYEQRRSSLLADKDRLIAALSELEFDHKMGKIPEADYPTQRKTLLNAGAAILRQLDELDEKRKVITTETTEDMLAGLDKKRDDEVEALIEERRRNRMERSTGFCPKCGKPINKSDRFCPRCGVKLVG
jgi:NADH pyrophosphatase NudC (nudix superfamily)